MEKTPEKGSKRGQVFAWPLCSFALTFSAFFWSCLLWEIRCSILITMLLAELYFLRPNSLPNKGVDVTITKSSARVPCLGFCLRLPDCRKEKNILMQYLHIKRPAQRYRKVNIKQMVMLLILPTKFINWLLLSFQAKLIWFVVHVFIHMQRVILNGLTG